MLLCILLLLLGLCLLESCDIIRMLGTTRYAGLICILWRRSTSTPMVSDLLGSHGHRVGWRWRK